MEKVRLAVLVLGSTLVLGCGAKGLPQPPVNLDLNGAWVLNEQASELALAPGDSARPGARPGGMGGPEGGFPGGGGRGGRPGSRGGAAGERAPGARMPGRALMQPPRAFTIVQTPDAVTFQFEPKRGVQVPTSGKKVSTTLWPASEDMQLSARWVEAGLRLERSVPEGGSVVEVYRHVVGASRLVVTSEVSTPAGKRVLRRVYERSGERTPQ